MTTLLTTIKVIQDNTSLRSMNICDYCIKYSLLLSPLRSILIDAKHYVRRDCTIAVSTDMPGPLLMLTG
jgi:hypothetical protein